MRQHRCLAKLMQRIGGRARLAIDEKFLTRANVRYPISGNETIRGTDMAKKRKKAKKAKAKKKKTKAKAKKKKAKRKKGKRTVLYSSKGKKLYAVRSADGKFKDIQSYQRAHSMDMKRDSADGN